MIKYNFPTTIYYGEGALAEFIRTFQRKANSRALIATDQGLIEAGLLENLTGLLDEAGMAYAVFSGIHPNPTSEDVENGAAAYRENKCDCIIALGGGSPIDAAKAIKIAVSHPAPLIQYDDAKGGDRLITNPMPPLFAIPTTAGTGSEVGRSAVIIMPETGRKTILFHPDLVPEIAVLEPELTTGLPPHITAASGIDALSHSMEAYFASGLHPMADGIALEGMALVLDWLPVAMGDGHNLEARGKMLLAASMGAVAFQKGLGMVHSLAHPLSSRHGLHHGLAIAILTPPALKFLEQQNLTDEQENRLKHVRSMLGSRGWDRGGLFENCDAFIKSLGLDSPLRSLGVSENDLPALSIEAFEDGCHQTNMAPVTRDDMEAVYKAAL